jgi:hypothetical protein
MHAMEARAQSGAGEGNRTLVTWLGTKSSTIELHPHLLIIQMLPSPGSLWPGTQTTTESSISGGSCRRSTSLAPHRATGNPVPNAMNASNAPAPELAGIEMWWDSMQRAAETNTAHCASTIKCNHSNRSR